MRNDSYKRSFPDLVGQWGKIFNVFMVNKLQIHFESRKKKQVKLSVNGADNEFTNIQC